MKARMATDPTPNRTALLASPVEPCSYCGGSGAVAAERNFLLERSLHGDHTWVGRSSTAMVHQAINGDREPHDWPMDQHDLNRCEETYKRAPIHLKPAMLETLKRFRRHIEEGGLYCRGCDNSKEHWSTRYGLCPDCQRKHEAAGRKLGDPYERGEYA
jgi:hypothetical protein